MWPIIYNADSATVAGSSDAELETVKNNFLIKKLGLADSPDLMTQINKVIEQYGRSNPKKYRAVVYYLLAVAFNKLFGSTPSVRSFQVSPSEVLTQTLSVSGRRLAL